MLSSQQEVINKIREVYKDVERLSIGEDKSCQYDTSVNGVGCFITAIVGPDKGNRLQQIADEAEGKNISSMFLGDAEVREIINSEVDVDAIGLQFLLSVQRAHDWTVPATKEGAMDRLQMVEDMIGEGRIW